MSLTGREGNEKRILFMQMMKDFEICLINETKKEEDMSLLCSNSFKFYIKLQ